MAPKVEYHDVPARAGIARWRAVAQDMTAFAAGVRGSTAEPWSRDKIGAAFAAGFDEDRATVTTSATSLADTVTGYPDPLTSAADAIVAQSSSRC